jgi:hypothetical protein
LRQRRNQFRMLINRFSSGHDTNHLKSWKSSQKPCTLRRIVHWVADQNT